MTERSISTRQGGVFVLTLTVDFHTVFQGTVDSDDCWTLHLVLDKYAGLAVGGRAKDKNAARLDDPLGELIETGRNVFPMALLRAVAGVLADRAVVTNRISPNGEARDYPLAGVLYCAHCADDAREKNTPALRVTISGHKGNPKHPRYRHSEGRPCRANNRSVLAVQIEAEFLQFLHDLSLNEDALPHMIELALKSPYGMANRIHEVDPEEEKRVAIAKCRRRIENAKALCLAGDLSADDYIRIKDENEREIAHWEAYTTDIQQAAMELMRGMDTILKLTRRWDVSPDGEKHSMVRVLFEYVEYDLDA